MTMNLFIMAVVAIVVSVVILSIIVCIEKKLLKKFMATYNTSNNSSTNVELDDLISCFRDSTVNSIKDAVKKYNQTKKQLNDLADKLFVLNCQLAAGVKPNESDSGFISYGEHQQLLNNFKSLEQECKNCKTKIRELNQRLSIIDNTNN